MLASEQSQGRTESDRARVKQCIERQCRDNIACYGMRMAGRMGEGVMHDKQNGARAELGQTGQGGALQE